MSFAAKFPSKLLRLPPSLDYFSAFKIDLNYCIQLTVPFNLCAGQESPSSIATDLEDSWIMLEIGSLGHFETNAIRTLSGAFLLSKQEAKQILMKLSRPV